jgi:hypothetical protein
MKPILTLAFLFLTSITLLAATASVNFNNYDSNSPILVADSAGLPRRAPVNGTFVQCWVDLRHLTSNPSEAGPWLA